MACTLSSLTVWAAWRRGSTSDVGLLALLLFYTGAFFAAALTRPALDFLFAFGGESLRPMITVEAYFSFVLTLVLGSNLPVVFVGWEGVGLCSYLLIGYFYDQEWCAAAGKKAVEQCRFTGPQKPRNKD